MQPLAPVEHDGFLERQPEEIEIGLVGEGTRAVELGDPDRHRRAVGDQAKALLAFAQGRLRQHLRGDVAIGADQAQRAAVAVALDLGDDADPAGRAVIRPHDAVFGRIVLALALQDAEQMLDRSLAILGMDSTDPFLVALVGRVGRQAVNQEIFGGAAVLDAVTEIDFETADAGDALDPRQLGFALLQRAVGASRSFAISCRCCRKRSAAAASGRTFELSEGVMRASNLCRHFHTGGGGFASFICSWWLSGSCRPCGTRRPARRPRNKTSGPAWSGPDRSGRPADGRCRGSR